VSELFGVETWFFVLLMVASLVGFVISSTFGVGGAILLIPLLAQRMPAAHAVALSAPVMLFNNVLKMVAFRRHIDHRAAFLVSALALPGAFAGAFFASRIDDRVILLGVAALIVLSIIAERGFERRVRVSARALLWWGGFTGAVSGLCGAAGPPTAIGLRGYGLDREAFVGTVALFAILLQLAKLPAYIGTGVLPVERWPLALALSAAALVGVAIAPALLRKIPQRAFGWALDALLAVSALWIVIDVIRR
jgi:uncharacterized membrane protein YfcA